MCPVTADSLAVIGESEGGEGLWPFSAAGKLHSALAGQGIASHVLTGRPDLGQEVLVAVFMEH
jgi:glycine/D-amino acid oxidase-like deaminating enzyme